jgi:hypothetical protein
MRIIQDDRTTSISASTEFSSSYSIDNVQDDKVSSRYIAQGGTSGTTATITLNLTGTASAPVEAFFISGLMADSGTWSFQNADGSSVHESGTLSTTDLASSDISGNPNTLNNYFVGQDNPLLSEFIIFSNPQTTTCRLVLTLTSSTDRKGQNIKGNAIASWQKDGTATGRFKDSSGGIVNLNEFGRVLVGSQITIGGTLISSTFSTNTSITEDSVAVAPATINGGVTVTLSGGKTLTLQEGGFPQVQSFTGGGTGSGSVTLSYDLASQTIASIINPIRLGIIRSGDSLDLPNPQIGVGKSLNDYSVKRRMVNGGYSYELRNIGKSIDISLILTNAQADNLEKFARAYRAKPFSALFLESMASGQNPKTRYSGFYYFVNSPVFSFMKHDGNHVSANFKLSEVI